MDFLKNLSLSDKDKEHEAPPAEPIAPAKSEHHSSHSGLLGKILGDEEKPAPTPVNVAKPPVEEKRSSFIDKITGHHDEEPPAPIVAPPAPEKHESFVDKLSSAFQHDPPPVPAKEEKRTSFVDKLFGGDEPTAAPAPPPKEERHLIDKLSGVFKNEEDKVEELKRREEAIKLREEDIKRREDALKSTQSHGILGGLHLHHSTPAPPPKEESFIDHISSKLGHKNDEPPPPQGLSARVNAILGGGHTSEAHEDGLDKAIDFVQKHILKKGDQSNESAFEQMTDEQISDTIRSQYKNMTGHDFPVKDKKH